MAVSWDVQDIEGRESVRSGHLMGRPGNRGEGVGLKWPSHGTSRK